MDLGKLLQMIVNMVARRALRMGVNKGIDMAVRKGGGAVGPKGAQMSGKERQAAQQARQAAKRARQAAAITRRLK